MFGRKTRQRLLAMESLLATQQKAIAELEKHVRLINPRHPEGLNKRLRELESRFIAFSSLSESREQRLTEVEDEVESHRAQLAEKE